MPVLVGVEHIIESGHQRSLLVEEGLLEPSLHIRDHAISLIIGGRDGVIESHHEFGLLLKQRQFQLGQEFLVRAGGDDCASCGSAPKRLQCLPQSSVLGLVALG